MILANFLPAGTLGKSHFAPAFVWQLTPTKKLGKAGLWAEKKPHFGFRNGFEFE